MNERPENEKPESGAPDLSTREAVDAYRAELRRVGLVPRMIGLGMVAASVLLLLLNKNQGHTWNSPLGVLSLALLAAGWVLLVVVIVKRSAYHRRRISGG
jgi:UDP-N-acetylmuramyl pentapeptide phosphotransferase/UDP-N-acetylglucosamine-1-phosphate transferase